MSGRSFNPDDPATIARLLPALRMMVRYPTRPVKNVSFETEVELSDLNAWVALRGRPNAAKLEAIERAAKSDGEAPAQASASTTAPTPVVVKVDSAPNKPARLDRHAQMIGVAKLLLANPEMRESAARAQVGVSQGLWSYFKTSRMGAGPVKAERLQQFIAGGVDLRPTRAKAPADPKAGQPGEAPAAAKPTTQGLDVMLEAIDRVRARFHVDLVQRKGDCAIAQAKADAADEIIAAVVGGGR